MSVVKVFFPLKKPKQRPEEKSLTADQGWGALAPLVCKLAAIMTAKGWPGNAEDSNTGAGHRKAFKFLQRWCSYYLGYYRVQGKPIKHDNMQTGDSFLKRK